MSKTTKPTTKPTTPITTRIPDSTLEKLDTICGVLGIKRSEFIIACINSQYDGMVGDPKFKDMLNKFQQFNEVLKDFIGSSYDETLTTITEKGSKKALKGSKGKKA